MIFNPFRNYNPYINTARFTKKELNTDIKCLETGEVFKGIKEVLIKYPTVSYGRLKKHLRGKEDYVFSSVYEGDKYIDEEILHFTYI